MEIISEFFHIFALAMNEQRTIRLAMEDDLPLQMELIECGRQKMRAIGNMEQWTNGNPRQEVLEDDIIQCQSYLVEEGGEAVATFAFVEGPDDTYAHIYDGQWLDDVQPYYVIHRIASAPHVRGILNDILAYCFARSTNIRIDTHRQNMIMRTVLPRHGFQYCGIIYLHDGAERLAYQRCAI